MKLKRISALLISAMMALAFASCGDTDSSDNDAKTSSEESTESVYDVNGDTRLYDTILVPYKSTGYKVSGTMNIQGTQYSIVYALKDNMGYSSTAINGMRSSNILTADGTLYYINDGTTTYSVTENSTVTSSDFDMLFSDTGDFVSAELDSDTNDVKEIYTVNDEDDTQLVFTFDGESYDLKSISYVAINDDSTTDEYITVSDITLSDAEDSDFVVPDLSSYTLSE